MSSKADLKVLPGLGGCLHLKIEFDIEGARLNGSNVIMATMQARCAACREMLEVVGPVAMSPQRDKVSATSDRQFLSVPMVCAGEKPRFPKETVGEA